jgi:hypothetical protein
MTWWEKYSEDLSLIFDKLPDPELAKEAWDLVSGDAYDPEAFVRLCDSESELVMKSARPVAAANIATIAEGKESMEIAVLETLADNSEDNAEDEDLEEADRKDALLCQDEEITDDGADLEEYVVSDDIVEVDEDMLHDMLDL